MENKKIEGLWIPIEILSNQNLSANEKLVLSIIKALDKGQGCFASNKYIAELIGLKSTTMSNIISSLKEKGFVEVTIEGYNTRTIKYIYEITPAEQEQEEVPANVIPIKSKSIIWRGIDLSTWDEEALERMKRRYPEINELLEGKNIDETKQPTFRTNEELYALHNGYADSNADVIEVKSDIDNTSKQLKLILKAE